MYIQLYFIILKILTSKQIFLFIDKILFKHPICILINNNTNKLSTYIFSFRSRNHVIIVMKKMHQVKLSFFVKNK